MLSRSMDKYDNDDAKSIISLNILFGDRISYQN